MRNFDEDREERVTKDRSFQIGGEVFTFKIGLRPETFAEKIAAYTAMTGLEPEEEALAIVDETIINFLESEDDVARWQAIRAREEGDSAETTPVTAEDMKKLVVHIFREQTGHPTSEAESSGNGSPNRKQRRSSTGRSSSPRVVSAE